LGADNGLGVTMIMAILEEIKTIAHPTITAAFTIDEETR
jgi:di/tripeptidase